MSALAHISTQGRMARLPFVISVLVIYVLSFLSQVLLSAPAIARLGVGPFALVQGILIWAWIVVHMRRLRDAGKPTGLAIGIALVYAIEVVFAILLVWLIAESSVPQPEGQDANILTLFVFLYLLALLTGSTSMLGVLQLWLIGVALLLSLPIIIAFVFSVTTASRPSVSPTAP